MTWPVPEPARVPGRGLPLRLRDTATGELRPVAPGRTATACLCGDDPFGYVTHDLLRRVLRDGGHDVVTTWHAEPPATGLAALNVAPPTHVLADDAAVPAVVATVAALRENGATYDLDGDTYLAVAAVARFGSVGNLPAEEMVRLAAARGDPERAGKKDPLDAVLWLRDRAGEPAWDAPWGRGRPGPHVTCAAIARATLGDVVDVYGGGTDLVFPHHEVVSAVASAATGTWPFARHWLHHVPAGAGDPLGGGDPTVVRLALLDRHYASAEPGAGAGAAATRLDRWRAAVAAPAGPPAGAVVDAVRRHLADDLNAPAALAAVDRWVDATLRAGGRDETAPGAVADVADALLGVVLRRP